MTAGDSPRVTLRGEFLRAERHLARAVAAERQVVAVRAFAETAATSAVSERQAVAKELLRILDGLDAEQAAS